MTWRIFRRPSGKGADAVASEVQRIDLTRIFPPPIVEKIPAETAESEGQEQEIDLVRKHEKDRIEREKDVYTFRKKGYSALFQLICGWLALVGVVLLGVATRCLHLSDTVLVALLTTSTATVLGIFAIAAKWLFPKGHE